MVPTAIPAHGDAAIVLLLCGGGGSLHLGMLLGDQGSVLLLRLVWVRLSLMVLLLLLMLHPRRVCLGILMLVGEDVLGLRLKHGG